MIKRNFMMAALILCMVANASVPIYASGGPGVVIQENMESYIQRRNPEQLSAEQIMTELYANVNNPMIQDGAKTEAMLLTGDYYRSVRDPGWKIRYSYLAERSFSFWRYRSHAFTGLSAQRRFPGICSLCSGQRNSGYTENAGKPVSFKSALQYSMGFKRSHFVHE